MAYLGTNLLERTTVRLLAKRRYGLIGRNGVGKRYSTLKWSSTVKHHNFLSLY